MAFLSIKIMAKVWLFSTQNSYYDYKKRFHGTEFYDWQGIWRELDQLQHTRFPQHKFENEDIPSELLINDDEEG